MSMELFRQMLHDEGIKCEFPGCDVAIYYYCNCNKPITYFCQPHSPNHREIPGDHMIKLAFEELSPQLAEQIVNKLNDKILKLQQVKFKKMAMTKKILDKIAESIDRDVKDIDKNIKKFLSEIFILNQARKVFHTKIDVCIRMAHEECVIVDSNFECSELIQSIEKIYSRKLFIDPIEINPLALSRYASTDYKINSLLKYELNIKSSEISDLIISPNQIFLVTLDKTGSLKTWNLLRKTIEIQHNAVAKSICCIEVTKDSKYILAADGTFQIKKLDIITGELVGSLKNHAGLVKNLLEVDGRLYSSGFDGSINVWNLDQMKLETKYENVHKTDVCVSVTCMSVSAAAGILASGGHKGTVKYSKLDSVVVVDCEHHSQPVNFVAIVHARNFIVSCGVNTKVKIWDYRNRSAYAQLKKHSESVVSVMVSVNSDFIASAGNDSKVIIWDIKNKRKKEKIATKRDLESWVESFPEIECYSRYLRN
jgi:WD40 repeat protein